MAAEWDVSYMPLWNVSRIYALDEHETIVATVEDIEIAEWIVKQHNGGLIKDTPADFQKAIDGNLDNLI